MQITFKDEDVKNLKAFLELVRDKAKFTLDLEENMQLAKLVVFMQQHIRQVNAHVMEVVKLHEPEAAPEAPEKPKSKGK